jgi:hypothetical protein
MSNPNQASYFQRHKYGVRRALAGGTALLVTAGLTAGVKAASAEGQPQPACEVPAYSGDTAQKARDSITAAGDNVQLEMATIWTPEKKGDYEGQYRQRDPEHDPVTADGSIQVSPGDNIRIENVDPQVCVQVGGHVVGQFVEKQQ